MKAKDILNKILVELNRKVKFAQMTLENGTVLEAEAFEAGNEVFIVTDEERIPLPVGEYTMEDGSIMKVTEEGLISEVMKKEGETEEVAIEAEEIEIEAPEAAAPVVEEIVQAVVEVVAPMIEEVKEEMKKMKEEMTKKKEEMSKQPAAKPIKHNPSKPEKEQVQLSSSRSAATTFDRVLSKLSNR